MTKQHIPVPGTTVPGNVFSLCGLIMDQGKTSSAEQCKSCERVQYRRDIACQNNQIIRSRYSTDLSAIPDAEREDGAWTDFVVWVSNHTDTPVVTAWHAFRAGWHTCHVDTL